MCASALQRPRETEVELGKLTRVNADLFLETLALTDLIEKTLGAQEKREALGVTGRGPRVVDSAALSLCGVV